MGQQPCSACRLPVLLILLWIPFAVHAQEPNPFFFTDEDIEHVQLPPLEVLFENAKNGATVEYFNTRKEGQDRMVKSVKREWMRNIRVMGNYQYGTMGANSLVTDITTNTPIAQSSNVSQLWYNVGISAGISFDEIFDRNNKVKRYKLEMKATEVEAAKWHDEQKLRIIESYQMAILHMAVLKVKSEAMILSSAQYKIAEADFVNGKIDPGDLASRKSIQTNSIIDYEQTKAQLRITIMQLEVLSNTNIINKQVKR